MSKIACAKDAIADAIENRSESKLPKDKGLDYAMELLYEIESEPEPYCSICGNILKDGPKKKPEPGEFTEKGRAFISQVLNNWGLISVREWVREACDIIDRMTAENKTFREKDGWKDIVHNQTNKIIKLKAELKAKDWRIEFLEELICKECGSDTCSTKAGCPFEQALKEKP